MVRCRGVSEEVLICPVCGELLVWEETRAYCRAGHSYDRAREGYVNLLLPNQKRSRDPGDSREMVRARRAFLQEGFYAPLSAEVVGQVISALGVGERSRAVVVDAGCGEGFHLEQLRRSLPCGRLYGFDVSKPATRLAARTYPQITWAVANVVRRIPVRDGGVDVLVSIFAPRSPSEIHRVLKPGGLALLVIPGPGHLAELCERLMEHVADQSSKRDAILADHDPGFRLCAEEEVTIPLHLRQPMIQHLVAMTPLRWKSRRSGLREIVEIDRLEVTASFVILSLLKCEV